ncbi:putative methionyl-tRNA synthetase [Hordeum vulgare]|nr:putative methionyl-tRNA synthetase [Hordeum vulgare]
MYRGEKAMANHWWTIQMACNNWYGIMEEVTTRLESGANVEGQMLQMFVMYRVDNEDQESRFLHVFSMIDSCEKWREVRLALHKAKETYNAHTSAPAAAEGRPSGTKKARLARETAPAAQWLQASIEQCIADVTRNAASAADDHGDHNGDCNRDRNGDKDRDCNGNHDDGARPRRVHADHEPD